MLAKPISLAAKLFFLIFATASFAQTQTNPYIVTPGKTDADDLPSTGAKVCLKSNGSCFQMPDAQNGDVTYHFGIDPHINTLAKTGAPPWLLFDATFSGGGSGTLTRYAILRQEADHLKNVLPKVALTNASEEAVWNDPQLSAHPIFVTADFIWNFDAGEMHFSKHHYSIEVWRYDQNADIYVRVLSYRTAKRYNSLDTADAIQVITPERPEILRCLATLTPKP